MSGKKELPHKKKVELAHKVKPSPLTRDSDVPNHVKHHRKLQHWHKIINAATEVVNKQITEYSSMDSPRTVGTDVKTNPEGGTTTGKKIVRKRLVKDKPDVMTRFVDRMMTNEAKDPKKTKKQLEKERVQKARDLHNTTLDAMHSYKKMNRHGKGLPAPEPKLSRKTYNSTMQSHRALAPEMKKGPAPYIPASGVKLGKNRIPITTDGKPSKAKTDSDRKFEQKLNAMTPQQRKEFDADIERRIQRYQMLHNPKTDKPVQTDSPNKTYTPYIPPNTKVPPPHPIGKGQKYYDPNGPQPIVPRGKEPKEKKPGLIGKLISKFRKKDNQMSTEDFKDTIRELIKERCWKGYKPVKGKKPYSKGSCTKESVNEGEVVTFTGKKREVPKGRSNIPDTGSVIDPTIKSWHKSHVSHDDGSSVTGTDAYESYCDHCERKGKEPLALSAFHRQWRQHSGHQTGHLAGRVRHFGIKLKEDVNEDLGMTARMIKGKISRAADAVIPGRKTKRVLKKTEKAQDDFREKVTGKRKIKLGSYEDRKVKSEKHKDRNSSINKRYYDALGRHNNYFNDKELMLTKDYLSGKNKK